ncbi:MAG: hypothetical protein OH318_02715 [Candidatus Parvarchaeota archaeon]|nr:hypothetical protein [Candidatus Rehaiarchaeum fermentans]
MESRGNIISFLDDDDLFTKDKLEYIFKNFSDNVAYIHNNSIAIDKNGNKIRYKINRIDVNMSCISIRKDIINDNISKISTCPDIFMYLSAIGKGKIVKTNKVLTYYRVHDKNISIPHTKAETTNLLKNNLVEYKKFYNFFDGEARKIINARITDLSISLYIRGENIEVKDVSKFLFNRYIPLLRRIKMVVAFKIYRFKFGRKLINKRFDANLEHLNRIRK